MIDIERIGFGSRDRFLLILNIILCIVLISSPVTIYILHGGDLEILILTLFGLGNLIITLVALYRFTIVVKYPYLVNLPALSILLGSASIDPKRRGAYINKIFGVMLLVGVLIGLEMLFLEVAIILNVVYNYPMPLEMVVIISLLTTFPILAIVFYLYNKIYLELKSIVGSKI